MLDVAINDFPDKLEFTFIVWITHLATLNEVIVHKIVVVGL